MSLDELLGPRNIPVSVMGRNVFAPRHDVLDTGHGKTLTPPIYDLHIGRTSSLPFDKSVYDITGNKIGEIEKFEPYRYLKRW